MSGDEIKPTPNQSPEPSKGKHSLGKIMVMQTLSRKKPGLLCISYVPRPLQARKRCKWHEAHPVGSRHCSSIPGARGGLCSQPRLRAYLELFKLPSSEAALEGPLFFDSHDLTPSTRSSNSESTSESPSLWDEEQKGRQGWEKVMIHGPGGSTEWQPVCLSGVGMQGGMRISESKRTRG